MNCLDAIPVGVVRDITEVPATMYEHGGISAESLL